jgi:hypothetical protein
MKMFFSKKENNMKITKERRMPQFDESFPCFTQRRKEKWLLSNDINPSFLSSLLFSANGAAGHQNEFKDVLRYLNLRRCFGTYFEKLY